MGQPGHACKTLINHFHSSKSAIILSKSKLDQLWVSHYALKYVCEVTIKFHKWLMRYDVALQNFN
jgi:hypothetical protein